MPLQDTGDIVKALGFVTLYAAYLEEVIDDCVESINKQLGGAGKDISRYRVRDKIEYCVEHLEKSGSESEELRNLISAFQYASELLRERNDVVHGRIYAQSGQPDVLKSAKKEVPDAIITSGDLIGLANNLSDCCTPLAHGEKFAIPRAFEKKK